MKGAITNYENTFYLNGTALSGIVSVDGGYNIDYKPINVLGKGFVRQEIASIPTANLSINRYFVTNDPILNLTGDGINYLAQSSSGGLYYKNKYFSFDKAYLDSFGINCSVGEVPQISSKFSIFGNIGPLSNPSGSGYAGSVFVPQVKHILVTCNNSSTNRVKDFSIDFNCPKLPIYGLSSSDSQLPIEVQNIFPIEVTTSFGIDIDNYETKKVFDDLTTNGDTSFEIKISGTILKDVPVASYDNTQLTTWDGNPLYFFTKSQEAIQIFNFSGSGAKILSEEITSSADELLSVKLSYKTYLN